MIYLYLQQIFAIKNSNFLKLVDRSRYHMPIINMADVIGQFQKIRICNRKDLLEIKLYLELIELKYRFNAFFVLKFPVIRKVELAGGRGLGSLYKTKKKWKKRKKFQVQKIFWVYNFLFFWPNPQPPASSTNLMP